MKKLLAILPMLAIMGLAFFGYDCVKEEPKQEAQANIVVCMDLDPGGGW
ncbi:complement C1q protein [Bacillus sp. NPDC077411]